MALAPVELHGCSHLFIDGGANLGEGVDAFYSSAFHRCALHSPTRLYGDAWLTLSAKEREKKMEALATPKAWCVRSFEANPKLLPALRAREAKQRADGLNVRYIDGLLGTVSKRSHPRQVVTYSNSSQGSGATYFSWAEIHAAPPKLAEETASGPAYDVRDVITHTLRMQPSAHIALRLDIEGGEFAVLDALLTPPALLCNVSYLFVEYHNLHANLSRYSDSRGPLPWNASFKEPHMLAYFDAGSRVKAILDTPGCRLQIHWRNFWNACGEPARYAWMKSEQATGLATGGR